MTRGLSKESDSPRAATVDSQPVSAEKRPGDDDSIADLCRLGTLGVHLPPHLAVRQREIHTPGNGRRYLSDARFDGGRLRRRRLHVGRLGRRCRIGRAIEALETGRRIRRASACEEMVQGGVGQGLRYRECAHDQCCDMPSHEVCSATTDRRTCHRVTESSDVVRITNGALLGEAPERNAPSGDKPWSSRTRPSGVTCPAAVTALRPAANLPSR